MSTLVSSTVAGWAAAVAVAGGAVAYVVLKPKDDSGADYGWPLSQPSKDAGADSIPYNPDNYSNGYVPLPIGSDTYAQQVALKRQAELEFAVNSIRPPPVRVGVPSKDFLTGGVPKPTPPPPEPQPPPIAPPGQQLRPPTLGDAVGAILQGTNSFFQSIFGAKGL